MKTGHKIVTQKYLRKEHATHHSPVTTFYSWVRAYYNIQERPVNVTVQI